MVLLLALAIFSSASAAPVGLLDQPLSAILTDQHRFSEEFLKDLSKADPTLTRNSPLRKIVSDSFFAALPEVIYPEWHSVTRIWMREGGKITNVLRQRLASLGVPANLTPNEIQEFDEDPSAFQFTRINDLPISGFHNATTLARRLNQNGIFFVTDFTKLYSSEMQKPKTRRFKDIAQVGSFAITKFYEIIESQLNPAQVIDLDQLPISNQTRSVLLAKGLQGPTPEEEIEKSGLGLKEMAEIYIALVSQKNQDSKVMVRACEVLLGKIR